MIGLFLIFLGSVISIIGAFGLIRFPDIYSRTHAQTVVNVGGTCLILLGVVFEAPFLSLYSIKSILLIVFIFLTSPVGSHAIARAAYKSGVKPKKLHEDELGYKIIQDERPFKKSEPEKPKKPKVKYKYKARKAISKTRERIRNRIPFRKKDDW
jgi:multicomponent Na+:H+ antiporter subunit G